MNVANILSTIAAMGLETLRNQLVLARLVNREYESAITGQSKGATVNVVVPAAVTAVDVTAAATPPSTTSVTPTVVAVTLDTHKEAPFFLTDFDLARVDKGIVPMQMKEAIAALAEAIENDLWNAAKLVYGFAGTPGTTPFATDLSAYLDARKIANINKMPMDPRFMIVDPAAESNALGLRAFQDASFRGDTEGIVNGQIGRKLGALWAMSQLVPTHTLGAAGTVLTDSASTFLGLKTVHFDGLTTKPSPGDVFTVAGDTQTYTVQSATDLVGTDSDVTIEPAAKVNWGDNAAVTFKASHVKNVLLHRDAVAFAMAPLMETVIAPNLVAMQPIVDPISGLSLRLEVTREHKRWRWSFDAMWGKKLVRPELGVIIAG